MSLIIVSGLEKNHINLNKDDNIIAGNWILNEDSVDDNHYENISFLKKEEEYINFTSYIKQLHEKISNNFILELNRIHNLNFNSKVWKIIIDPWITYYLENIYFRWKTITNLIKEKKNLKFVNFDKLEYGSPFDQNEFQHLISSSDTYNHFIFQKILTFLSKKNKNIKVINVKDEIALRNNYNYISNDKKISFIKKFSEHILTFFSVKNSIYVDLNCGVKTYIKLSFYLNQLPFKGSNFFLRSNLMDLFNSNRDINNDLRSNLNLKLNLENEFENFLNENFHLDIPLHLIEKFKDIFELANKIPIDPKIIVSDTNHRHNTIFKFWIMKYLNRNTKLITSDHGGIYGNGKRAMHLDEDVSFKSLKWHKPIRETNVQLPVLHLLRFKNFRTKIKKRDRLLLICHDTSKFPKFFSTGPISNETLKQLYFIKNLNANLDFKIKKNYFVRPYFVEEGWKIYNKIKDYFDNDHQILNNSRDYRYSMKKSKLILVTYPKTAFIESLMSGPTILLYDPKFYRENKDLEKIMLKLKMCNIIFENPKEAALHINKYWDNIHDWWNSKNCLDARKDFFTDIALYQEKPFREWKVFLKNIL